MVIDFHYWTRVVRKLLIIIFTFVILYFGVKLASFYMPFLVAFIISLMLEPLIRFLMRKLKLKRKQSSIVVIIFIIGIIIGLIAWAVSSLISEGSALLNNINEYVEITTKKIQDMIEEKLKDENYLDVFKSFSEYRERRAQSRRIFLEEKKQHKFLKALEDLTLKTSSNENENNTPLELMVDYGSTVSREFAKAYIVKKKMAELQESGEIHIHDLNFMPLGTTTTSQINLLSLFDEGFKAKNICIREPQNIMSYSALAVIAITLNQKEQHGCQSIPAFDYYMAPGVLKTFKKQFQETINDILAYSDLDKFAAIN